MERKQKKGNISDVFVWLMIITFLAFAIIVVVLVNTKVQTVITNTPLNSTSAAPDIIEGFNNLNTTWINRGFILMFSILILGVIMSAFLTRIHPAFFFLYLIVLGATLFLAALLGNIYADFTENTEIAAIAATQPVINYIMLNPVKITLIVGALSMFLALSKIFSLPGGGSSDV